MNPAINPRVRKFLPYIVAVAIFMQMLDSTILNTALPAIAEDLNESALAMQSAIISYVLTLALFIPVSGFLADKFGTRKIFITAIVLFSLGSVFCALSTSLLQLDMARVFQGLGGAFMTPVARLTMIKTYPKHELVQAMNFAVIPALIGPILGPLVGGYLVEMMSWHWIFIINIPMGILGIIFSLKYMPDFKDENPKLDLAGFLIFGSASILLSVGLEMLGHSHRVSIILVLLLAGFIALYLYYRHALKKENPLFPLHLFQVRTFRLGIIGNLLTRLGISSIPLLIPLVIQIAYGKSASTAGWIVAPLALGAMIMKPVVIPLIDKFGYRNILRFNTIMLGFLICTFAIPGLQSSIFWFIPVVFVLGLLNSLQFTAMNTIALSNLRNYQNSSGNSLLTVNQQLAIGFGIGIGMAVLNFFQTNDALTQGNIHTAFRFTFVVIGFLTILSSLVFRKLHPTDGDNLKSTSQ
ncbi:MAG: DHA2 family efflux MFS transporter permease subunit [Flavobacteriaceae bacterium]|nr:DHA2 family efflux MFS transporter permease subunit [Flavobacteriaceae bacterium]